MSEFYTKKLEKFVGWKILHPCVSNVDEWGDEYFGLVIGNGKMEATIWFLQDDEGNGPGSFEIEERSKK